MRQQYLYRKYLTVLLLLIVAAGQAQSWQWGKRGGTIDPTFNGNNNDWEQVRSIVTDNHGNVYILTAVGIEDLDIDGHSKQTYGLYGGGGGASFDYVITSFGCDGAYRWSKVIGGQHSDSMQQLQIDAQDNIYAVGMVYNEYDDFFFPGSKPQVHFDNDLILPYAISSTEGHQSLFIIKYTSDGSLVWVRNPQPTTVSSSDTLASGSIDLQVDPEGNSYWVCYLINGSYANGAFVNNAGPGSYLLKYDTNGIFISASLIDIQVEQGVSLDFKMRRNHNNGTVYLFNTIYKTGSGIESVIVGGQSVNFSKFIAAFDSNGTFLWKKENNALTNWSTLSFDLTFDSQDNIYFTGAAGSILSSDPNSPMESFNGQMFDPPFGTDNMPCPFVVKLDASGNTIWQTSGSTPYPGAPYSISVNGDEVAAAGAHPGIRWGDVVSSSNHGYDPYIARFNKSTGAVIAIETFTSTTNADDYGTAITADSHGNYFLGGRFKNQVTVGPNTLVNGGADTDFFVAKFGTDTDCALGVDDSPQQGLDGIRAYPNPVKGMLHLDNSTPLDYALYNILGAKVSGGSLQPQGSLDMDGLPQGMYLLQLADGKGNTGTIKLINN